MLSDTSLPTRCGQAWSEVPRTIHTGMQSSFECGLGHWSAKGQPGYPAIKIVSFRIAISVACSKALVRSTTAAPMNNHDHQPEKLTHLKLNMHALLTNTAWKAMLTYANESQARTSASKKAVMLATDNNNSVLILQNKSQHSFDSYSPYGHSPTLGETSALTKFNGERKDPVSSLYLLGNGKRPFSNALMRFLSPDRLSPFGKGGINAYVYCSGDPVNFTDPSGQAAVRRTIAKVGTQPKGSKTVHTTTQGLKTPGMIDIPQRDRNFLWELKAMSDEKLAQLKSATSLPRVGSSEFSEIIFKKFGGDEYSRLYLESEKKISYVVEMHSRGLDNFFASSDVAESQQRILSMDAWDYRMLDAGLEKKAKWSRPSALELFGISNFRKA
ncbi:YD repeat protein [Pseudomonas putida]|nr:YD repeat protein [Pseudomonas putida]